MLQPNIFRTYDIRGIVGDSLTNEGMLLIGKAIGSYVRELGGEQITIACDGRTSSPALLTSLSEGLLAVGCDVIDIGMVPTPLLYYATHIFNKGSGVMITGSHNPANYNGAKIVIQGKTLSDERIRQLYDRIVAKKFTAGQGIIHHVNICERYIRHLIQNIKLKRPLKIVIDAGNGVTSMIAPKLFKKIGCEVHELYCQVDGNFPHHHPDPSQAENLQDLIQAVKVNNADIGLAFDGDGDRLGVVTKRGEIIWPDRLLMLFAKSLLQKKPHARIIFDVKCSNRLAELITALGGEPIMWKTGHSLIKAKLAETQAQLAGEMSGHFFFKDRWFGFDDALYAGARLLEILAEQEEDSDTLFASIPNSINTPELKIYVEEEEKLPLMQQLLAKANFIDAKELMTIDGLRVNFAEGWGLVRPSNTTPCLILRFEALNEAILQNIQLLFRDWLLSVKADLVLPF